jgi:hypothetical protein
MGSFLYCSGYGREPTVVTPFSHNQGVITDDRRVVPYTVLPAHHGNPAAFSRYTNWTGSRVRA